MGYVSCQIKVYTIPEIPVHLYCRESPVGGCLVQSGGGLEYSDGEESGDEDEDEL